MYVEADLKVHSLGNKCIEMNGQIWFNPFPHDKILDQIKLKAYADGKLNVTKMIISVFDRVEKIVGKGEIACTSNFSFSHHVFKRPLSQTCRKVSMCGKGLNWTSIEMHFIEPNWAQSSETVAIMSHGVCMGGCVYVLIVGSCIHPSGFVRTITSKCMGCTISGCNFSSLMRCAVWKFHSSSVPTSVCLSVLIVLDHSFYTYVWILKQLSTIAPLNEFESFF